MIQITTSTTRNKQINPTKYEQTTHYQHQITFDDKRHLELLNAVYDLDPDIEKKVFTNPVEQIRQLLDLAPALMAAGLLELVTVSSDRSPVVSSEGKTFELILTGLGSQLVASHRENPALTTFEINQAENSSYQLETLTLIEVENNQTFDRDYSDLADTVVS